MCKEKQCCEQCDRNRNALATFIAWTAQSASSPISRDEALRLLSVLDGTEKTDG